MPTKKLMSPRQLVAARNWLRWTQHDMQEQSGVNFQKICRIEREQEWAPEYRLAMTNTLMSQKGISFKDGVLTLGH